MMLYSLRSLAVLADMKANQWKSPDELEGIASGRLSSLLRHAAAEVPRYKGIACEAVTVETLSSLPITRKRDMQSSPDSFISVRSDRSRLRAIPTSGSTGMPLTTYCSFYDIMYSNALRYHLYTEAGLGPLDLQVQLSYAGRPPDLLQRLGLFRCRFLSFSAQDQENLLALKRLTPSAVLSYPSVLHPLALSNERGGYGVRFSKAFTTGEMLSRAARDLISGSFGCSIRNRYGTVEAGTIAWECERGSMHINSDSVIVEVVDERGRPLPNGKIGNLLVTPLWRYPMPFIRYWIGDRGSVGGRCACGRGLPVLSSLKGRDNGAVILPSGRLFIATYIGAKIRSVSGVIQFQVVQESRSRLVVRYVRSGVDRGLGARIRGSVLAALPEPMEIETEEVQSIRPPQGGKACDFLSKVRPETQ
ncbi:MAG: hypothetical protein U0R44_04950 [Candidatus Micrarchaeia archaeon]